MLLLASGVSEPGWGLVCLIACWAPPVPQSLVQACLHKTGVPYDSPLEGQSPCDFAFITPGKARRCLFYFNLWIEWPDGKMRCQLNEQFWYHDSSLEACRILFVSQTRVNSALTTARKASVHVLYHGHTAYMRPYRPSLVRGGTGAMQLT